MKLKRIIGILTLLAAVSLVIIFVVLMTQGTKTFSAILVQAGMCNLAILVGLSGLHLSESHASPSRVARMAIWGLGVFVILLGILVSFNIIDYQSSWNHLLSLGIIFITLVELQLLRWERAKNLLKILGLLTILSNVFIAIYFMAKLSMPKLGMVLDIAVITSVFAFLIGLILSRPKKQAVQE